MDDVSVLVCSLCCFARSISDLDTWHWFSNNKNKCWVTFWFTCQQESKWNYINHMLGSVTISLLDYANQTLTCGIPEPTDRNLSFMLGKWLAKVEGVNKYFKCLQVGRHEKGSSSSFICVSYLSKNCRKPRRRCTGSKCGTANDD